MFNVPHVTYVLIHFCQMLAGCECVPVMRAVNARAYPIPFPPLWARACGWRAACSSPSNQDQARVDGVLSSTRASKSYQQKGKDLIPDQLSARAAGTVQ